MNSFLIIGQGIAGTMLAFELIRRGQSVLIVDDRHASAASMVDIATTNPVTGRRYAKSWNIDALIPLALEAYDYAEQQLGQQWIAQADILQVLPDNRVEEIWMLRAADPEFEKYLDKEIVAFNHPGCQDQRAGRIHQGFHLRISAFLRAAANWFTERQMLLHDALDTNALEVDSSPLRWYDRGFDHIVCCDGYRAAANPFFDWLELYPMKGEYLVLRIPDLGLESHLKTNVSLIPMSETDLYWCGSTYDRYNDDFAPSAQGRKYLLDQVGKIVTAPYTVEHHGTGIRATTRDRRPYVGTHPEYPDVHLITGMGTKGASLAPFCASVLAEAIMAGGTIPGEVDILRHIQR